MLAPRLLFLARVLRLRESEKAFYVCEAPNAKVGCRVQISESLRLTSPLFFSGYF